MMNLLSGFHRWPLGWVSAVFVSFALFLGNLPVSANEPACKGNSMLNDLQTGDAGSYETMTKEAEATINGAARLWKIERAGAAPSYLFGTMHLTDLRVVDLTTEAKSAFDSASTVVIESTEVLDSKVAAAALLSRPDLMMFTDGKSLESYLEPAQALTLEKGLSARGIKLDAVNKMKPWLVAGMVSLPACEANRKKEGAPFLDIKLAQEAQTNGKKLVGLETIAEQLDAMASLPMELHVKGLLDSLSFGNKLEDVLETMIVLYTDGRIGAIVPFLKAVSGKKGTDQSYSKLEQAMIVARNRTMQSRALPLLENGSAFIAVGALHLPGNNGLVELFRQQGFVVTAISK